MYKYKTIKATYKSDLDETSYIGIVEDPKTYGGGAGVRKRPLPEFGWLEQ